MEDLPPPVVVEIMSRLGDSTDLARCRLASRYLRSLSYDVHSIAVVCSRERFLRSRAPATRDHALPFRSLVLNLLFLLSARGSLRSLSLAVEDPHAAAGEEDEEDEGGFDEADDLHLAAPDFLLQWLPEVGPGLRSLSIKDYWYQACWRCSTVLRLISDQCHSLLNLELRNAWLSVEGLKPMLTVTSLHLEFIRIEDENLDKINECFPFLQNLKLIGVGGLTKPKICLSQLQFCHWTVSNFPLSLAIHAPSLLELHLACIEPKSLVLEAPLLSRIDLKIRKLGVVKLESFLHLKSVRMETSHLGVIKHLFEGCKSVKQLEAQVFNCCKRDEAMGNFTLVDILTVFPNLEDLYLGPGAWTDLQNSIGCNATSIAFKWRNLKRLTIKLPAAETKMTHVHFVLNFCISSCEVTMLIHKDSLETTKNSFMALCCRHSEEFKWKLGVWNESCIDIFLDFL
ncbi:hypothetical protein HPP92_003595 [Vanilla planifolia]|uniref:F-box domain-containing protein n=1 Tax=Vanilla planifolia TaxID=51239 RepID=A0A835S9E4_VANPL|nr:hypothetical protein HPP92_003983 [Vanilla planifolia]KAG0503523.1 hypothetical protein HPP92_003595 [Vanilla planifolia]